MNSSPLILTRKTTRRRFLRGLGVTLGLPVLDQFSAPAFAKSPVAAPRRMLLISNNLGVLPWQFFPKDSGPDYTLSPYLEELRDFRNQFTVCSGLSHPAVVGGHSTENCFLTAAKDPTGSGFRNSISLDQFAVEHLGQQTRFPTLNLGVNIDKANRSLAWTRDGCLIPPEDRPSRLFETLFLTGGPADLAARRRQRRERESILDALGDDTRRIERRVSAADRRRLDHYLTSIRELEERLEVAGAWEDRPRPAAPAVCPDDVTDRARLFAGVEAMLEMARLAIETDSTRLVTLMIDAFATPAFRLADERTTTDGYHNLSHHGQSAEKVAQLEEADRRQMDLLAGLFTGLAARREGEHRLLDRTIVLYGSNLGDANTHDNTNLPILLAGGGFRHGSHLAFPHDDNVPLANLFVSILERLGIESDGFASSTGRLAGLEA